MEIEIGIRLTVVLVVGFVCLALVVMVIAGHAMARTEVEGDDDKPRLVPKEPRK